ncbi:hypothetical protein DEJ50_17520 [Streptomyces venezuelae]|uniref:Uncharacterized protein n=1 Tax=Streptomyces venezuelae TaxID=54571 RepID=A0A5P2D869_STRVZ|nr:hypothetical protein [Streptomyces venezuelae]QES49339.1 hypothetical protein DEJ50_17520 [Streptomyces venezuelae]
MGDNKDRNLVERFMEPPEDAILDDRPVRILQEVRFWCGIGIALVVKLPVVMQDPQGLVYWVRDGALRIALTPVLLLLSVPVVLALYIAAARPGYRRRMISRLPGPLTSVAAFLGHFLLGATAVVLPIWVVSSFNHPLLWAIAVVIGIYLLARAVGFVFFAVPAISRHMFRTVEVHQALPACLTVVLAWELALQDIFFPLGDQIADSTLLPLGGAIATMAIAAFELFRLRTRHGITFRSLPPERPRGRSTTTRAHDAS